MFSERLFSLDTRHHTLTLGGAADPRPARLVGKWIRSVSRQADDMRFPRRVELNGGLLDAGTYDEYLQSL